MSKRPQPFNNAFANLKLEPKKAAAPKPPAPVAPTRPAAEDDEAALFRESVGEVQPVKAGSQKAEIARTPPPPRGSDAEEEALLQLSELVAGEGPFDLADSDEFVEGAAPKLDPRIVRKLHRGDYAVQGHLDLHGLTRAEAKAQLDTFLLAARHNRLRCVLVVHGRGLHSKDQIPILKESVQRWLTQGRLGRMVLAFATARQHDGGAGAVYVLLRR